MTGSPQWYLQLASPAPCHKLTAPPFTACRCDVSCIPPTLYPDVRTSIVTLAIAEHNTRGQGHTEHWYNFISFTFTALMCIILIKSLLMLSTAELYYSFNFSCTPVGPCSSYSEPCSLQYIWILQKWSACVVRRSGPFLSRAMLTASGQAIAIGFRTCPQLVSTTTYTQVLHASQLLAVAILVQSGYTALIMPQPN